MISDVSSRGPIAKLGFREGDRIVSVNGQRVAREEDFIQYLLRGDSRRVKVIVLRDNREETIYVEPAVLIDDREYMEVDPLERFGIIVDDRYDDRIVVWRIIPRSPAYYAGFRPGDVIVKFGDRPYRTRTEFERGSRDWKTGERQCPDPSWRPDPRPVGRNSERGSIGPSHKRAVGEPERTNGAARYRILPIKADTNNR